MPLPLSQDSTPPSAPEERDLTFDLLRGAAILFIAGFYHIEAVWVIHLPPHLSGWLARVALAIFCFISGYLLASRTRIKHWRNVGDFYIRRCCKIYPPYLLALLLFVALGQVPPALLLPSALLVNTLINWNLLTLWFISMIFVFYAITPLFLWRPGLLKTSGLALIIFTGLSLTQFKWGLPDPRLLPNFVIFILGILTAQTPGWSRLFLHPSRFIGWGSLLLALLVLRICSLHDPVDQSPRDAALSVGLFVIGLPVLMGFGRILSLWLPARVVLWLSQASYLLYLLHRIIYHLGEPFAPAPGWSRQFYYVGLLLPFTLLVASSLQTAWDKMLKPARPSEDLNQPLNPRVEL